MRKGKVILGNGNSVSDVNGNAIHYEDKIAYASGTKSWIKQHLGYINRVANSTAFLRDEKGYEIPMKGSNWRIVIADDSSR